MCKDTAWMLAFHCICHRLALGANEAAAMVELCKTVDELLRATSGLFTQSANRLEAWQKIAKNTARKVAPV